MVVIIINITNNGLLGLAIDWGSYLGECFYSIFVCFREKRRGVSRRIRRRAEEPITNSTMGLKRRLGKGRFSMRSGNLVTQKHLASLLQEYIEKEQNHWKPMGYDHVTDMVGRNTEYPTLCLYLLLYLSSLYLLVSHSLTNEKSYS